MPLRYDLNLYIWALGVLSWFLTSTIMNSRLPVCATHPSFFVTGFSRFTDCFWLDDVPKRPECSRFPIECLHAVSSFPAFLCLMCLSFRPPPWTSIPLPSPPRHSPRQHGPHSAVAVKVRARRRQQVGALNHQLLSVIATPVQRPSAGAVAGA